MPYKTEAEMRLLEAKRLFYKLRKENRIDVCEEHVLEDHAERGYSREEVINLVLTSGSFEDTNDPHHSGVRFFWRTKDINQNKVRLVLEFEEDEKGQLILVISAGERT